MTLQTTKIIRYSVQGFKPQYQSEHLKNINYHLNDFNINDFPEHLRYIIQKQHEEHLSFLQRTLSRLPIWNMVLYRWT